MTLQGDGSLVATTCEYDIYQAILFKYDPPYLYFLLCRESYISKKFFEKNSHLPTSLTLSIIPMEDNQRIILIRKGKNTYSLTIHHLCLVIRGNNSGDNSPLGFERQLWKMKLNDYKD